MSLMANESILSEIKAGLENQLTSSAMDKVMEIISTVIGKYDISPVVIEESGDDVFLDTFIDAICVEGRSKNTIHHYRYLISRFLKAVSTHSVNITQYHIRKYLSEEKNRGISDQTIRGYCWVFSSYFGWLHREGIIRKNPMWNIGKIKVPKKEKDVFTETDVERLKQACNSIRDKAIICFLKSTGCRVSEVTNLNIDDIDFVNLECIVLGKGNKERTVYLDSITSMVLQNYLSRRQDDNPALFVSKLGGRRLQPGGIRCMLKNLSEKTGVQHVHPHKFRRTEITELVNKGMPIEQVKTLAGHEKIDTTMSYVVMNKENIKYSYRKFA